MVESTVITMINVFIANIFLMNLLVAIISTVYNLMTDEGQFHYKSNVYQFIEKYSVAMQNKWKYYELVIYPPPTNIFTIMLWPCLFSKRCMKVCATFYSKTMYWIENILFYIIGFFIYELVLVPYLYFKVFYHIGILATPCLAFPMILFWIVCGPFYLFFSLGLDMLIFIKILGTF